MFARNTMTRCTLAGFFLAGNLILNVAFLSGQETQNTNGKDRKIDQTGVEWVMPFSAALEKAKTENRILAIKMIAFGTNSSGCW